MGTVSLRIIRSAAVCVILLSSMLSTHKTPRAHRQHTENSPPTLLFHYATLAHFCAILIESIRMRMVCTEFGRERERGMGAVVLQRKHRCTCRMGKRERMECECS